MDGDGNPVEEQTVSSEPCLSAHVALVSSNHMPEWHRIACRFDSNAVLFTTPALNELKLFRRPPCRAPPLI
ncbi:MAG: hypothetical protein WA790_11435 [Sulfitobacter sp.]